MGTDEGHTVQLGSLTLSVDWTDQSVHFVDIGVHIGIIVTLVFSDLAIFGLVVGIYLCWLDISTPREESSCSWPRPSSIGSSLIRQGRMLNYLRVQELSILIRGDKQWGID